jgi:hypothetical protein
MTNITMPADAPAGIRRAAALGWAVFESEIIPHMPGSLGWWAFPPPGYDGPELFPQPPDQDVSNLFDFQQPRRARGPSVRRRRRKPRV